MRCVRCGHSIAADPKIVRGDGAMTVLHADCFGEAMKDDRDPLIIAFARDFSYSA